ncbi:MAG: tRNA uridine-5-carboxymethylaminomethyl(34) synthesis GTPase MnmE [Chloroflexi bacterium]|nr:tRNA uridine-5-carboxymethylaminomethyl(34) synthesis GTPase MnmE [Ktedonobacteraceae bacterium]MBV9022142.1 tRNA uridine-5-carboxymethylaminomethyl(34) synthesis GTPase MnmE [Ktedonobacteraceae bacterium]MBV9707556.1 tRNA uridine-5-carboxymethylaminomethyl(34) synthesis GTPase MnmE [Chloroflexota bacterium]
MHNDTIAAIATPLGMSGIGVIRVSGADAFALVLPLLRRPKGQTELPLSHLLTYGQIVDTTSQEVLDEVLVAFMCAPHTYTREDVVEIQGHGGPLILRRILQTVLAQGARMANPGEFTLRAFLNGRLDLTQAEAVMDLIGAQTEAGQRLALQQLRGYLSQQIQRARCTVLKVIVRIEASIDFPEEDVPTPHEQELLPLLYEAQQQLQTLLAGYRQGKLYRQGLRTAIIGRPNVGKSSLLNALLRAERAIVTPIAGTTRDTIEEVANLRGVPLYLIDTAGIMPTDDPLERVGVERSRAAAESADVVLLVFDGSEHLTTQDRSICHELKVMGFGSHSENVTHQVGRPMIVVINKSDREQHIEKEAVSDIWPYAPFVTISTFTGAGLSDLEEALAELVLAGKTVSSTSVLLTNARHEEALQRTAEHLRASLVSLNQQLPLDFVSIDLRAAYDALGEVTGETASDALLDSIFSEFCIGK